MTKPATASAAVLAYVAFGAALIAISSILEFPIGPGGTPITLQTFAVLLVGAVLGPRRGALAAMLYLLVGALGLPVFSGGSAGLGVFASVTAGYLIGFPFAAALTGWVTSVGARALMARGHQPFAAKGGGLAYGVGLVALAALAGALLIHVFGIPMLAWRAGLSIGQAALASVVFLPLDLVKVALVAAVAPVVHRAYPGLL